MNRWILILLPSIFLFGFGAAELSQTKIEIKYPSNWPKPNYDFERRERERTKAADTAKKAQAKADKRVAEQATPDPDSSERT